MSLVFIAGSILAQFIYVQSAVVGVVVGLFSRSWRLLIPLAVLATLLDLALMVVNSDDPSLGLVAVRKNLAYFAGTTLVAALGHAAIGTWVRGRLSGGARR